MDNSMYNMKIAPFVLTRAPHCNKNITEVL